MLHVDKRSLTYVTRRLAHGLSLSLMITPSFVAGLSQVRPERLIEKSFLGQYKQRQVDVLTKSSLRLPTTHTVVYICRDL
jgi:hypothetical protein